MKSQKSDRQGDIPYPRFCGDHGLGKCSLHIDNTVHLGKGENPI